MSHSAKEWFFAMRPWSYPASTVPVIAAACFLYGAGHSVDWLLALAALLNIILFHSAANTWSDYHDFNRGVDTEETAGATTLTTRQFRPAEIRNLSIVLFVAACALGIVMVCLTSVTLLWVGLAGLALSLCYPPMKFNALGDLNIFLTFCALPAIGVSVILTGSIVWEVLLAVIPIGLMVVAILHFNNARDIAHDRSASIRTFAMVIGIKASYWVYALETIIVPSAWALVMIACGIYPVYSLLFFAAIPLVLPIVKNFRLMAYDGHSEITNLDERTAQVELVAGLLLSASFIIQGILS